MRRALRKKSEGRPRLVGAPVLEAHLRAGDRRRRMVKTLAAASTLDKQLRVRSLKTGADKDAADGGRQAVWPSVRPRPASRLSCSTAADFCFMGASKRSPMPPARAAWTSRIREELRTVARSPEGGGRRGRDRDRDERDSEFSDKLVHINRVAQGGQGRQALRVRGPRGRWRPEGPRRLSVTARRARCLRRSARRQKRPSASWSESAAPRWPHAASTIASGGTVRAAWFYARHLRGPASSQAARCAPSSKCSVSTTL